MTVIKRETKEAAHAVWKFGKSSLEEMIAEPRLKKWRHWLKTQIWSNYISYLEICKNWLIQGILANTGKGWIIGECGGVG